MTRLIQALAVAALTVPSTTWAATWEVDPAHSGVTFSIRHMVVANVHGRFGKVEARIVVDDKDVTKSILEATIDVASVDTNEAKRDEHLKSADFFDVAKFPKITFKSKKVEKVGKDKLKVIGDVSLHGVTKELALDVTGPSKEMKNPWGQTVVAVSAAGKLSRKDFGLTWNKPLEGGTFLVGDDVTIAIDAEFKRLDEPKEAVKEAPAAPAKEAVKDAPAHPAKDAAKQPAKAAVAKPAKDAAKQVAKKAPAAPAKDEAPAMPKEAPAQPTGELPKDPSVQ